MNDLLKKLEVSYTVVGVRLVMLIERRIIMVTFKSALSRRRK